VGALDGRTGVSLDSRRTGACPGGQTATRDFAGRDFDLVVVEATPGGIAMAVRAAREGLSVLLVNHNQHLGGILSSGLGVWDTLWEGKRSPIYDEARQAIFDHYRTTYGEDSPQYRDALPGKSGHTNGKFEARVAEKILTGLVTREKNITVLPGYYPAEVSREGAQLKSVTFRELGGTQTLRIPAKVFADWQLRGRPGGGGQGAVPPLGGNRRTNSRNRMPASSTCSRWRRLPLRKWPAVADLHDRLNLRKFRGFQVIKLPDSTGEADGNVQAFNYRTSLSSDPEKRVLVEKPANYDPAALQKLEYGSVVAPIPNQIRGWNRPQLVGPHTAYVEGDWATRRKVMDLHWDATVALLYLPAERTLGSRGVAKIVGAVRVGD
jgi:hypothetical protein